MLTDSELARLAYLLESRLDDMRNRDLEDQVEEILGNEATDEAVLKFVKLVCEDWPEDVNV